MAAALDLRSHPHRRLNPLTGRSVMVSPHRNQRPWVGQQEAAAAVALPRHDPGCDLCAGNARAGSVHNPNYASTFVFDNDFAALLPDVPAPPAPARRESLLASSAALGRCRVVCFSPDHSLTVADMAPSAIAQVVARRRRNCAMPQQRRLQMATEGLMRRPRCHERQPPARDTAATRAGRL